MRTLNRAKIEKYSKDPTFTKYFFRENIVHSKSDFLNVCIDNKQYKFSLERLTIRKFRSIDYIDNNNKREIRFNSSYRIVLYLEGETKIYVNGLLSYVDPSFFLLQSPGKQISVTPKVTSDFIILEFYFDLTDKLKNQSTLSISEYFNLLFGCELDNIHEVNNIRSTSKDELQNLFSKLYDQLLEDDLPESNYRCNLTIFNIFNRIVQDFLPHNRETKTGLNCVIRELKQNYNRDFTIEELAGLANLSKHYFQNLFKKTYGITPIDYLNRQRIKHAKFMLKNYDYSCNEISYNIGFKSPFYFSKVFKKYTGESPTEYRMKSTV